MSKKRRKKRLPLKNKIKLIELEGLELPFLEVGRVTSVQFSRSKKEFIYLEKNGDGKWNITYTENTIPEEAELDALVFIREN